MTKFWGELDQEQLTFSTPDEAIEEIIDALHPAGFDEIGEITVYEYGPLKPSKSDCGMPLENVLEHLDEEYGNPDSYEGFKATEAMIAAEQAFMDAVLAEYVPWMCQQTGEKVTVNALEWVKEHRPGWLASETEKGA